MKMYSIQIKPLLEILNQVFPDSSVGHDDLDTRVRALRRLDEFAAALPGYDKEIVMAIWELSAGLSAVVAFESRDVLIIYGPEGWRHKRLTEHEYNQLWEGELNMPFDRWFDAL